MDVNTFVLYNKYSMYCMNHWHKVNFRVIYSICNLVWQYQLYLTWIEDDDDGGGGDDIKERFNGCF